MTPGAGAGQSALLVARPPAKTAGWLVSSVTKDSVQSQSEAAAGTLHCYRLAMPLRTVSKCFAAIELTKANNTIKCDVQPS